jgi:hypothetical protein
VRRLVPVLALVAALALAAPASAQDRGEPVVGGGSFAAAPLLEAGRFHDTILPGEYLYYGFRLAAGQSLRVTLTHPDIENLDVQRLGVVGLGANIHSPARTIDTGFLPDGDKHDLGFGIDETEPLVITSPEVEAEPDASTARVFKNAGVYYLALHALWAGKGTPPRAEIPFTFEAEVRGTAQPNVTPTPTPTATATASPRPTPAAESASEEDGDGPAPAVAAVGGVAGILLGAIAGIARGRRRR